MDTNNLKTNKCSYSAIKNGQYIHEAERAGTLAFNYYKQ
jgi:hypothetical protein